MKTKVCSKCKIEKPIDEFNCRKKSVDGHACWCRACAQKVNRKYYQTHLEEYRVAANRWRQQNPERAYAISRKCRRRVKIKVLTYYGGGKLACIQCGFDDVRALSIDHLGGSGANHRKHIGVGSSTAFYRWLIKNNYPKGYQTLCFNCQLIKVDESNERSKGKPRVHF